MSMVALAVAGLAVGAVGAGIQYMGQRKAAKAAQRAEMLRKRQMNLESKRNQRAEIRKAQITRAQLAQQASDQGAGDTSAVASAQGAASTAAGGNILFNNQATQIGNQIFDANAQAAKGNALASLGGAVIGVGGLLGNASTNPHFA